jgi:phytoene synthase
MPAPSSDKKFATAADAVTCRAMLRGGSRSFFAASLALPKSVREPATGLYAFCRMADDAIDLSDDKAGALQSLRARLDRAYAGNPQAAPADRAFADVVSRFAIPKAFPLALLEGFEWDCNNRRYDNLPQLKAYAVRVAGSVGAMMAMVMGVRNPALIARACDLGVAMQLTNIARDVGEDARRGRLYLPLEWLRAVRIDPQAWLARPIFSADLGRVIERLLAAADVLYSRSDAGLGSLPAECRPGMYAARLLYSEIGREVARRKFDSVNQRAVVSWQRKARVLAGAAAAAARAAAVPTLEISHEAAFLFDSNSGQRTDAVPISAQSPRERTRWPRVEDRAVWLVNLFERLERRDILARNARHAERQKALHPA